MHIGSARIVAITCQGFIKLHTHTHTHTHTHKRKQIQMSVRRSARLIKLEHKDDNDGSPVEETPAKVDESRIIAGVGDSKNTGHSDIESPVISKDKKSKPVSIPTDTVAGLPENEIKHESKPVITRKYKKRKPVKKQLIKDLQKEQSDTVPHGDKPVIPQLQRKKQKVRKFQAGTGVALPRIGKTTTTIHKTADKLEIIKVFKRKSIFPDEKKTKKYGNFRKPSYRPIGNSIELLMEFNEIFQNTEYHEIAKDMHELQHPGFAKILDVLENLIIPFTKDPLEDLHIQDFSINKDDSFSSPTDDTILHDLFENHMNNNSINQDITKSIAQINNIDISHIDSILKNLHMSTNSSEQYTNDKIIKDQQTIITGLKQSSKNL